MEASVNTPTKVSNHLGTFYFTCKESADEFIDKAKHLTLETLGEIEGCFEYCHREDGPAIELINGHKEWRVGGDHKANNEDPNDPYCIITADNRKYYYRDGFLHDKNEELITNDTVRNDEFGVTFWLINNEGYAMTHYGVVMEFDGVDKVYDTDDLLKLVGEDHRDVLNALTSFSFSIECFNSYRANNDQEDVIEYTKDFHLSTMEYIYNVSIGWLSDYKKLNDNDDEDLINLLKAVTDEIKQAKQFVDNYDKWINTPINNYGSDINIDYFASILDLIEHYDDLPYHEYNDSGRLKFSSNSYIDEGNEKMISLIKLADKFYFIKNEQWFQSHKLHSCQGRYFITDRYSFMDDPQFTVWRAHEYGEDNTAKPCSSYDTLEDALESMRELIEEDNRRDALYV